MLRFISSLCLGVCLLTPGAAFASDKAANLKWPNGYADCREGKKVRKRFVQDCTLNYPVWVEGEGGVRVVRYRHRSKGIDAKTYASRLAKSGFTFDRMPDTSRYHFSGLRDEKGRELVSSVFLDIHPLRHDKALVATPDFRVGVVDIPSGSLSLLPMNGKSYTDILSYFGGSETGKPSMTIVETKGGAPGTFEAHFIAPDGTVATRLGNLDGKIRTTAIRKGEGRGMSIYSDKVIARVSDPQAGAVHTLVGNTDGSGLEAFPDGTEILSTGGTGVAYIVPVPETPPYIGSHPYIDRFKDRLWWFVGTDGELRPRPAGVKGFIPILSYGSDPEARVAAPETFLIVSRKNAEDRLRLMQKPKQGNVSLYKEIVAGATAERTRNIDKSIPVRELRDLRMSSRAEEPEMAVPHIFVRFADGGDTRSWYVNSYRPRSENWLGGDFAHVDDGARRAVRGSTPEAALREAMETFRSRVRSFDARMAESRRIADMKSGEWQRYAARMERERAEWEAEQAERRARASRSVFKSASGGWGFGSAGTSSTSAPVDVISSSEAYKQARDRGVQICRNTGGSNCDR